MKVAIVTSLLALSTGLTAVLAFPILTETVNLTARGETDLNARDNVNGFLAAKVSLTFYHASYIMLTPSLQEKRDEESTAIIARREEMMAERAEERKKKHHDPYWCGAPFCPPHVSPMCFGYST